MTPEQIVLFGVAAMPVIAGVVEAIKRAGMPSRYAGVLAILFGIGAGAAAALSTDTQLGAGIAQGLLAGLGASGVWSVGSQIRSGELTEKPKRRLGRK